MGAWIETCSVSGIYNILQVASYVGAWIETQAVMEIHPVCFVASYVGAWIETSDKGDYFATLYSRILRGCVD